MNSKKFILKLSHNALKYYTQVLKSPDKFYLKLSFYTLQNYKNNAIPNFIEIPIQSHYLLLPEARMNEPINLDTAVKFFEQN